MKTTLPRPFLSLALLATAGFSLRAAVPELVLGDVPLLFADDSGVRERRGVERTVHPARTRAAPVLRADQPWEGQRVYTYGSVHRDPATGLFRLWYMSRSQDPGPKPAPQLRAGGQDLVLYATSPDGVTWTKPALNIHEYRGSRANNIVADFHTPAVVIDLFEADPARRFKLLAYYHGEYIASYSADGIRWTEYPKKPAFRGNDTMSMTMDPRTGEFLAFFKKASDVVPGRLVWLARSRDFETWSEPKLVFHGDAEDNRWARGPDQRMEVYNMAVVPHAAGYLGFPTMFRVTSRAPKGAKLHPSQSGNDGPIDVQLVTSTDAEKWERSYPRVHLIPRGAPGAFDGGAILGVTSTATHDGDITWMLYTGINTGHGGSMPPKELAIGRAEWRLHGFTSLDAGPMGGRIETRDLRLRAGQLLVNADARRGALRVGLTESNGQPIPGCAIEDCEPLRADATRHGVRWKSGRAAPTDRAVRVVIELNNARLYSLAARAAP